MLAICKPTVERARRLIARAAPLAPTFPAPCATRDEGPLPAGFDVDRYEADLGRGAACFARAASALGRWAMIDLGWVAPLPPDAPVEPGTTLAVAVRATGLWWLNPARIAYAIDERAGRNAEHGRPFRLRFGFAYVTLPGHAECGEERFLATWDPRSDVVRYEILAVSRPAALAARLGYPLVRRYQRRFGRDSVLAMRRAVA